MTKDVHSFPMASPATIDTGTGSKRNSIKSNKSKAGESAAEGDRGGWGRPLEFILACLGYAVGLGNVWRFPYLTYKNGGGAFFIPYILMMFIIGVPIFYLELYLGQYTGVGPIEAFSRIAPGFYGLGYCTLMVISLVIIYYMIIVAWALFYTFMSFNPNLGWGSCDNDFNSLQCYSGQYDLECKKIDKLTTYVNKSCVPIKTICERLNLVMVDEKYCHNATSGANVSWATQIQRTLASEEYYNDYVLGIKGATWEEYGTIQWHLVGCLALSWFIAFLCVIKGVQSAGKVVYFTALFPYVMLTTLLIRGVTLDGAVDGIIYYISPKWSTLLEATVWGDAASQIFYSFGLACGSLITLASYNKFTNNCHFDAWIVSFSNLGTSILAGFAIFSVLGFLAMKMGVDIQDVAQSGPGLAFVAYPEAILQMPIPQLWAILFFIMLFILGLGSQFAGIEAINTAIIDNWPFLRNHKWKVTLGTCTACFIMGLPMCFSGGVYLFTLLEWNTASWAILLIGMAECGSVAWCYGINRALGDLRSMKMKLNGVLRWYWWAVWTILSPIFSFLVFIFLMVTWNPPAFGSYNFPVWADVLGWIMAFSTLAPLFIGFGWVVIKKGIRGKDLITTTSEWGPAEQTLDEEQIIPTRVAPQQKEGEVNLGFT